MSACSSAGAATATGRTASGIRTVFFAGPVHVRNPVVKADRAALLVVNFTVNDFVWPALVNTSFFGVTVTPALPRVAVAVYVPARRAVTRRVTVCTPARPPTAIDGTL